MSLFENENFIVVDKPPAVLTTPAREKSDSRACLGLQLQEQLGLQIYPVHRLDFEVSGLVLFAKNPNAHRLAQGWFETALVDKYYEAFSAIPAQPSEGEWQEWNTKLVRGKRRSFEAPHGKPSLTRARVLDSQEKRSHWELQPVTGRPHQLRVEMARHGYPILGDKLYGAEPVAQKGIALRAVRLDFSRVGERLGLPEKILTDPLQF